MKKVSDRYNNILVILVALAPFLGWLTYTRFDMNFFRILQLLSYFGLILVIITKKNGNNLVIRKYLLFYLLFILYDFFSTIYILGREFEWSWLIGNHTIAAFNLMFIIQNSTIQNKTYNWLLIISKVTVVIAVVVIIIQQVYDPLFYVRLHESLVLDMSENENRLVSIYSWIGGLTMVGFGFVPLFIFVVEQSFRVNRWVLVWIMLGLIYAFLSKARWIMLNTSLVFLLYFMIKNFNFYRILKIFFLAFIVSFSFYFTLRLIGVDVKGVINERILEKNKSRLEDKSMGTRILAITAFDKVFWDKPIWGHGNVKFGMGGTGKQDYKLRRILGGHSSQIHIGYLSLFYLYGIIGAFLFFSFLINFFRSIYIESKRTNYWAPFIGLFGFVLANLTLVTFSLFEVGLIIMIVIHKYYLQNLNQYKIETQF